MVITDYLHAWISIKHSGQDLKPDLPDTSCSPNPIAKLRNIYIDCKWIIKQNIY